MSDYKVRVNSEVESKEVQELFFELGYVWFYNMGKRIENVTGVIKASSDGTMCSGDVFKTDHKEITIDQLRDLVVLKRNDVKDATHVDLVTGSKVLQQGDKNYYWQLGEWHLYPCGVDIRPIEKEMKEYINRTTGEYRKTADKVTGEQWVEVSQNHNFAFKADNGDIRFSDGFSAYFSESLLWTRSFPSSYPNAETPNNQNAEIEQVQDSEVKLRRKSYGLTEERAGKISLNTEEAYIAKYLNDNVCIQVGDTICSAKHTKQLTGIDETLAERQATYGDFKSVANTTGQLMAVILNSKNGQTLPYAHEEALHMICSKIARIANGDYNSIDGWHDIAGYATLIERLIGGDNV